MNFFTAEVLEISQNYICYKGNFFIFAPRLDFGYASNLKIHLLMQCSNFQGIREGNF
jgi:hypothetical protein